ncbi:hypothetical protein U1Q18_038824 [Sarracenia purpurea var. burkii]
MALREMAPLMVEAETVVVGTARHAEGDVRGGRSSDFPEKNQRRRTGIEDAAITKIQAKKRGWRDRSRSLLFWIKSQNEDGGERDRSKSILFWIKVVVD